MANCKSITLLVLALLITYISQAQRAAETSTGEKVEVMNSAGKVYVVMAVVITILAGLILYMVRLDRKLSKLEKGEGL